MRTILKDLREDRDLHQKEVASYLGVSRSAYSNYENGSREPGIEILKKLADFFRVSMDELLGYTPKKRGELSLGRDERDLVRKYRALSDSGRKRMLRQVELELDMERGFGG